MKKFLHLFSSSNEGNKLSKRNKQDNDQKITRTPWKSDSINFGDQGNHNQAPAVFEDAIRHRGSQNENRHDSLESMKYATRKTSFGHNPPQYEETQRGPSEQSTGPLTKETVSERRRQKSMHLPSQQYTQANSKSHEPAVPERQTSTPPFPFPNLTSPLPDCYNDQGYPKSSYSDSTFWESGSALPLPRFNPQDILIAVMGMTGAGKTSFISKIAGIDMKIGHGLSSCTKEVGIATMEYQGRRVHFIDTPGFDDTELKDADILEVIALYLTNTQSRRVRLSGILYLHRITDPRVGGTALKNIKLFRGLVGNRSMGNVVLVTTMWGLVSAQDGAARMDELAQTDGFWGSMIKSGATCDKYDGTWRDGLRIINKLLQKTPCILQIQEEMERGAKLTETTAGKEVNDRIAEIEARYKKEIEELRLEMKQAQDARELETLLREQEAARAKMEEAQRAKEILLKATIEQQAAQIHELQNGGSCVIL